MYTQVIMKQKYCPKCKSTNIELKPTTIEASQGLPPTYKCKNCGFESIAFPEKETIKQQS